MTICPAHPSTLHKKITFSCRKAVVRVLTETRFEKESESKGLRQNPIATGWVKHTDQIKDVKAKALIRGLCQQSFQLLNILLCLHKLAAGPGIAQTVGK